MSQDPEYTYLDDSRFEEEVLRYHKPVIVEFGSDWCGTCRMMAPIVDRMSATYCGQLRVVKVDFDQNKHLVDRYGIQAKPTFLFIKHGEVVDHIISSTPREDFEARIKRLLSIE